MSKIFKDYLYHELEQYTYIHTFKYEELGHAYKYMFFHHYLLAENRVLPWGNLSNM